MGHHGSNPVTMKTLAQSLGVSVTTVSNAYSKPDRLSDELRQQIFAKAKELGYCGPSAAGRALRSGKSGICGFVFGSQLSAAFSDPYTVMFMAGLGEALEEYEASVLLLRSEGGDDESLQRAPVDAVVSGAPIANHPGFERLAGRGVRVVGTTPGPEGDWVGIDDRFAGRLIGQHLARLGHRRVAVVVPWGLSSSGERLDVELAADGQLPPSSAATTAASPRIGSRACVRPCLRRAFACSPPATTCASPDAPPAPTCSTCKTVPPPSSR